MTPEELDALCERLAEYRRGFYAADDALDALAAIKALREENARLVAQAELDSTSLVCFDIVHARATKAEEALRERVAALEDYVERHDYIGGWRAKAEAAEARAAKLEAALREIIKRNQEREWSNETWNFRDGQYAKIARAAIRGEQP